MSDVAEKLVTQPDELAACCAHLAVVRRMGMDTEFVGEDTFHPRLCLIQVATDDTLYVIDPFTVGPLDAFWNVVVDPANLVVVHAGREEVRLCHLWSGRRPGNLFDLQIAAGLVGLPYPMGHGSLVYQVLGVQLAKGETLTEWRHRPLTRSQIRYALDDVRHLLGVWQHLSADLERLGRTDWAREEFERLLTTVSADLPGTSSESDRWRKLRGLGPLDRRRLGMVRELFFWREQKAAEANRPTRSIVRDDLLIEIARRGPAKPRDLHMVRGLARRYAEEIVNVIEAVRALPAEQLPDAAEREQDPPQFGLIVNVINAVLADFSVRQRLAANLVATSQDVKSLVRARFQGGPLPADSLLTRGWRAQHILPELEAVLNGQRTLRIADIHADAPFAYGK